MSDALVDLLLPPSIPLDAGSFEALLQPFGRLAPTVAIAVSGGADSMALASCLQRWGKAKLVVFIVDHGLRAGSINEAQNVKDRLDKVGLDAHILTWQHEGVSGRLHEKARVARYSLLIEACHNRGVTDLFLGHNKEDQAETVLMRLSKGSHMEGLGGMMPETLRDGVRLLRPFLTISKNRLIATCEAAKTAFELDPSNASEKFARGRLRRVLPLLANEGMTIDSLVTLGQRAKEADDALAFYANRLLQDAALFDPHAGTVSINKDLWKDVPLAVSLRALSHCLRQVHRGDYPPDRSSVGALLDVIIRAPRPTVRTLHGCLISLTTKQTVILREMHAITDIIPLQKNHQVLWDERWLVTVNQDVEPGTVIRALGSPSHQTLDRLAPGLRRRVSSGRARSTLPAIWQDNRLLAIPSLDLSAPFQTHHVKQAFP